MTSAYNHHARDDVDWYAIHNGFRIDWMHGIARNRSRVSLWTDKVGFTLDVVTHSSQHRCQSLKSVWPSGDSVLPNWRDYGRSKDECGQVTRITDNYLLNIMTRINVLNCTHFAEQLREAVEIGMVLDQISGNQIYLRVLEILECLDELFGCKEVLNRTNCE